MKPNGRRHFRETKTRSVIKALSYRALILVADGIVIYLITHKAAVALAVVIISNVYSTVLYFLHERVWNSVKWGKVKVK